MNNKLMRVISILILVTIIGSITSVNATSSYTTTDYVNMIGYNSAMLHGTVINGTNISSHGFIWSQTESTDSSLIEGNINVSILEVEVHSPTTEASNIGEYEAYIDNLKHRKDIYIRSYIVEDGTYYYGEIIPFITEQRDFSLELDGDNDAIIVDKYTTENSVLRRGVNYSFSFEFWMKVQEKDEAMLILSLFDENVEISKLVRISYGKKIWFLNDEHALLGADTVTYNEWTHIAFTYDGEYAIGYLNGEQFKKTNSINENTKINGFPTANLVIGGAPDNEDGEWIREFKGHLDAIRFWNLALTKEQIQYLLYDRITASEDGGVKLIGSGHTVPNLEWDNLSASFDFNVKSVSKENQTRRLTELNSQEDINNSKYNFFHENSNLNTEKNSKSNTAYSYNIIAHGDAKPSPDMPRVNWRNDATENTHWTTSESWSGHGYPGQGIPAIGYEDITSTQIHDNSAFCEYTVINASNTQKAEVIDSPPSINILVDRELKTGTYTVTNTGKLEIMKAIQLKIFESSEMNIEDTSIEIDNGHIEVENGSIEVM